MKISYVCQYCGDLVLEGSESKNCVFCFDCYDEPQVWRLEDRRGNKIWNDLLLWPMTPNTPAKSIRGGKEEDFAYWCRMVGGGHGTLMVYEEITSCMTSFEIGPGFLAASQVISRPPLGKKPDRFK